MWGATPMSDEPYLRFDGNPVIHQRADTETTVCGRGTDTATLSGSHVDEDQPLCGDCFTENDSDD